jgi:hypothetical protein
MAKTIYPTQLITGDKTPLDGKTIVETLEEAESYKYDGYKCYVKSEKKDYSCKEIAGELILAESNSSGYVHPATHNAAMITEDENHRFVTDVEKEKIANISETSGSDYVHPATHPASMIQEDETHHFVSLAQINTWNNKASNELVTQLKNGLMSLADKTKLDNIQENTNNYVHPATHPATIIQEDETHRFITDTERATWNEGSTHPATHPATMITEDETHRFTTDTEKSTWNSIISTLREGVSSSYDTLRKLQNYITSLYNALNNRLWNMGFSEVDNYLIYKDADNNDTQTEIRAIKYQNGMVHLTFKTDCSPTNIMTGSSRSWSKVGFLLPEGFRPMVDTNFYAASSTSDTNLTLITITTDGLIAGGSPTHGGLMYHAKTTEDELDAYEI